MTKVLEKQKEQQQEQQEQQQQQQCDKKGRLLEWLRADDEPPQQGHQNDEGPQPDAACASAATEGLFTSEHEVEETLEDLFDAQSARQLLIRKELQNAADCSTIEEPHQQQLKPQQPRPLQRQDTAPEVCSLPTGGDATPTAGLPDGAAAAAVAEAEMPQDTSNFHQQQQQHQQQQADQIRRPPVGLAGAVTAFWQGTPWDVGLEDWEIPAATFDVAVQEQQQQQLLLGQDLKECKTESPAAGPAAAPPATADVEEVHRLLQLLQTMAGPVLRDDAAGSSMRCVQHISRVTFEGCNGDGRGPTVSAMTVWLYRR